MSEYNPLEQLNRSLGKYILITFAFSWLLWLPSLLSSLLLIPHVPIYNLLLVFGAFGPFVAGFSLTLAEGGFDGVKSLWYKGWHCEKKIYLLIAVILIPLLCIFALLIANIFDRGTFNAYIDEYRYGYIFTQIFVLFFFSGPIQEEFGWRGYALYYLQSKMTAFESSLILGGIWSVWHYPLFFITDTAYTYQNFYSFTISLLALSIIFTWLNNNTNGSILVAMIFHTSINATYSLFLVRITPLGSIYFIILLDIVMVTILIVYGQEKLKWTSKKRSFSMKFSRKTF
ncbi:MAG: CPBP family intramembrane glutamic endopeptidase [Candidatus Odinarchaeota archaeon]